MTSEYVTEPIGFKVILGGSFASLSGWLASVDWATVIGVTIMCAGFAIQVAGWMRSNSADKRDKEKHAIEMEILRQRLEDLRVEPK